MKESRRPEESVSGALGRAKSHGGRKGSRGGEEGNTTLHSALLSTITTQNSTITLHSANRLEGGNP